MKYIYLFITIIVFTIILYWIERFRSRPIRQAAKMHMLPDDFVPMTFKMSKWSALYALVAILLGVFPAIMLVVCIQNGWILGIVLCLPIVILLIILTIRGVIEPWKLFIEVTKDSIVYHNRKETKSISFSDIENAYDEVFYSGKGGSSYYIKILLKDSTNFLIPLVFKDNALLLCYITQRVSDLKQEQWARDFYRDKREPDCAPWLSLSLNIRYHPESGKIIFTLGFKNTGASSQRLRFSNLHGDLESEGLVLRALGGTELRPDHKVIIKPDHQSIETETLRIRELVPDEIWNYELIGKLIGSYLEFPGAVYRIEIGKEYTAQFIYSGLKTPEVSWRYKPLRDKRIAPFISQKFRRLTHSAPTPV